VAWQCCNNNRSALRSSLEVIVPTLRSSCESLQFCTKRCTRAVTRNNFLYELWLDTFMTFWILCRSSIVVCSACADISSPLARSSKIVFTSRGSVSQIGQRLVYVIHVGPVCQILLFMKMSAETPCVNRSGGLSCVGQYFQLCDFVNALISDTLLETNFFSFFVVDSQ